MDPTTTTVSRRGLLRGAAAAGALGAAGTLAGAGTAQAAGSDVTPLWQTAWRKGLVYGTSLATWQEGKAFSRVVNREAGLLFTEDDLLWYKLKPRPDSELDFSGGDAIRDRADRDGQLFFGAHLVWDEGFGNHWSDEDLWDISEKRARRLLFGTARQEVRHYRGQVCAWIVCNEVTSGDPSETDRKGRRTNVPWYQTIGPSYIEEAFVLAREEDPDATLVLNEFGFETVNEWGDKPSDRQRAFLSVVDDLLAKDVPLDALGIQAHLLADRFADRFRPWLYTRFLDEIAARGLHVLVTELDVLDEGLPTKVDERDRRVADVYRRYLDCTLGHEAVKAVVNFGLSDKYTWLDEDQPRDDGTHRRPLPFSRRLEPKPAFRAVRQSLIEAPVREPLWTPPRAR